MNLRQVTIEEKEKWNQFVSSTEAGSFLHSWEWIEFLETQKDKIWRFVVEVDGDWQAVLFCFKSKLKLGQSIMYSPRGPIMKQGCGVAKVFEMLMKEVNRIAKQERVMSFQVDPQSNDNVWGKVFEDLGFEKSLLDIQPRHTLIIDIRKEEDELLKQMHQKTRYNLRLADKKGVNIVVDNSRFKDFHELLKKTEERQKITLFGPRYFKQMLNSPLAKLYLAEYEGKVIGANIMIFWNHQAVYLFGASAYEYRNVMAPYLMQWQAIQDAKHANVWFYDFWGAAPEGAKGQEAKWSGFSRFKKGFSPELELTEYVGTYEKVYQPVKLGFYRYLQKIYKKK